MLKKTAIALSLAMVAGTGVAQAGTNADADMSASAKAGNASADLSTKSALAAKFKQLDSDHDGKLSRAEAKADPKVGKVYDSLDTDSTIEKNKSGAAKTSGINKEQFTSGMKAAMKGGAVGPAASGGGTYTQMKDGTQDKVDSMKSKMNSSMGDASSKTGEKKADDAMGGMSDKMHNGQEKMSDKMDSSASSASDKMSDMKDKMKASGSAMGDKSKAAGSKMSSDASDAHQDGMDKADQAAETSSKMKMGADADAQMNGKATTDENQ